MYLLLLTLPLISAIIGGLLGRYIGSKGAALLTTLLLTTTASIAFIILYETTLQTSPTHIQFITWIESNSIHISWGLLFDSLTAIMCIVVTIVSTLVHLYSTSYMEHDPHLPRFMSYLSLFTFFMLILVTADNLLQLFIGWEGVGLCSYLLINFWFTRIFANLAAIKAMVVNRIGDLGLLLGLFTIIYLTESIDYMTIFSILPNITLTSTWYIIDPITLATIFLLIGAIGKSAQLGLHTWLPDAMEGPTPVSALIHAATMVTAGVYLIIRCSPMFELTNSTLTIVTIIGSLTAFFAATVGLVQNDLKRVIAYSTASQLGYMIFACGVSNFSVSLFHLMNHAFFKALLFLSAGAVLHALNDEQDMRRMGGIISIMPFTYSMMLLGSMALMGFPFLTGYYSKDLILELSLAQWTHQSLFAYWLGTISALFTAFYSWRLISLTFLDTPKFSLQLKKSIHEPAWPITVPLFILGIGSLFIGYLGKDAFLGQGSAFLADSLWTQNKHLSLIEAEFLPYHLKWTPVVLSISGATLALWLYNKNIINWHNKPNLQTIIKFLSQKWYFDLIYNHLIVIPILNFGHHIIYKTLDRGLLEQTGPYGITNTFKKISIKLSSLHSGHIYHSAFLMILGVTLFLIGTETLKTLSVIPLILSPMWITER